MLKENFHFVTDLTAADYCLWIIVYELLFINYCLLIILPGRATSQTQMDLLLNYERKNDQNSSLMCGVSFLSSSFKGILNKV